MTAAAAQARPQWWAFQPQSRFWHFQFIEGGWLLTLIAATIWLVRRHAA